MKRILAILLLNISLSACTTKNQVDELATKEKIILSSGKKEAIVEFYKRHLWSNDDYKIKLVNTYLELNDVKSAELYASLFVDSDMDKPGYRLTMADLSYQKGDLVSSEEHLSSYLKNGGEKSHYYILLGKIRANQKKYVEALSSFKEARKHGATDQEVANNTAVVRLLSSDYQGAINDLHPYFLAAPENNKIRSNLLLAALHAGNNDVALEVLKYTYPEDEATNRLSGLLVELDKNKNDVSTADNKIGKTDKRIEINKNTPVNNNILINENVKNTAHQTDKKTPNAKNRYCVQVTAWERPLPNEYIKSLKGKYGSLFVHYDGELFRYCVGTSSTFTKAKTVLNQVEEKGAFITTYHNCYVEAR
ncbi:hypothetical protein BIT28_04480 [Photobacterium proteolyticum]|uniref:Uncharacterized protein n=1 Tax=Photobacterium proteolyticum TaxID=1903952 RepID=A0A1Q9H1J5_9GAMM|nr:hypothetical protein [Photobacterium proteolyticum]OLQ81643.1 hypothetical protein BIT28_04480 [Photobacterium proteolyticum]